MNWNYIIIRLDYGFIRIMLKELRNIENKYMEDLGNAYLQYLNIKSVRDKLLEIISLLDLDSITFFVDEWEKISQINNCQEYTARYIDRIIDDPIFFWLGIVPYRGGLYCLDNGADLQHQINLDESLIFEGSSQERLLCINYFKQIVNKRLNHYLKDEKFNYKLMFNSEENFSLLVMIELGDIFIILKK